MVELSQTTSRVIQHLFQPEQQSEVEHLLKSKCGAGLIPQEGAGWDRLRERVQLGVLKESGGDVDELLAAISLAQTDWRDLLMAAGFGLSVTEHEKWAGDLLRT